MSYAICEPRKFRVLRRFDDLGIADAWAVSEIRARRRRIAVPILAALHLAYKLEAREARRKQ